MKKILTVLVLLALVVSANLCRATILFSDNFDSYTDGALAGQGTWAQTAAATPLLYVNSGLVYMTNGQDVYSPLTIPTTLADGESVYFSFDVNVSTIVGTGDYFLHFTPNNGNTSLFYSRLFVRSNTVTGMYQLGWLGTSGGAATPTYGTTDLDLNTTYHVVMAYNYSSLNPTNASGAIYVNPTDPVEGNNTAYVPTTLWTASGTTTPDTNSVAAVNLRQGGATSAPRLTLDNLVVATAFSDVVIVVPEPSAIVLASFGGLLLINYLRRKR